MTEAERVHATCEDCGKGYRVPDGSRTYTCKACGGTVGAPKAPVEIEGETCPSCQALSPPGTKFCEECGESLTGRRRRASAHSDNTQATRDLKRAEKAIAFSRFWLILYAVLSGLLFLGVLGDETSEPGDGSAAAALVLGVMTAVLVTAAVRIKREPFLWTTLAASVWTLVLVFLWISGGVPGLIGMAIQGGMLLGMWSAVLPAMRARRILTEFPDLLASRKWRGDASPKKRQGREHRRRVKQRESKAAKARVKSGYVWGGLIIGLPLIILIFQFSMRVPGVEPVTSEFQVAWNGNDIQAVSELFLDSDKITAMLERTFEVREWSRLPLIDSVTLTEKSETKTYLYCSTPEGVMRVSFLYEHGEWLVRSIKLPKI